MAERVSFVVDGFNLYHSLKDASNARSPVRARWLDLKALCQAHLYIISTEAVLQEIYYFSALAKHLEAKNPGLVARHELYADAIRSTGVRVEFANFLAKQYECPHCHQSFERHEEKQTDVALGSKIVELAHLGGVDTIVVLSADSDLIPAIRTTRRLFGKTRIFSAFPAGKGSNQLKKATHGNFTFSAGQYAKHQLPDPLRLPSGRILYKPSKW